jgi:hypothetical protein
MRFGGRAKRSNKKLDENFGRNLSSFIIRYRLAKVPVRCTGINKYLNAHVNYLIIYVDTFSLGGHIIINSKSSSVAHATVEHCIYFF